MVIGEYCSDHGGEDGLGVRTDTHRANVNTDVCRNLFVVCIKSKQRKLIYL